MGWHAKLAENGAKFLDEHVPGWYILVSRKKLDMKYTNTCVLGQLYGSFRTGCEKLRLTPEMQVDLGFASNPYALFSGYVRLNRAWSKQIERRRKERGLDASLQEQIRLFNSK